VVPYVRHVVKEMGCTSVRWYNHINEPLRGNIAATPPGVDDHVRYVEVLAAIRQGLNEAGLGHIGLMGPDTCTHMYWPIPRMLENGADPDPHIQAYCMHQYHSHFDWDKPSANCGTDPMSVSVDRQLATYCAYAHAHGKPYLVTEIGMFHYGWRWGDPAGIARHDNVLLETEFIVRGLAKGADGFLRWAWLNPGNKDGWWQLIETVDGSDQPVRDSYYGYGTLYRQVDRNADMLMTCVHSGDIKANTIHAAAVANRDGSRSLLVVNDAYSDIAKVLVRFPTGGATRVHKLVNDPVRKCHDCGEIAAPGGQLEPPDALSPMSRTV